MKQSFGLRVALIAMLGVAGTVTAEDNSVDTLTEMVTRGKAGLDFRYRYENVDDDDFNRTASANTLRSRLTLSSAPFNGVSALAEVDNVWDFGSDNYNSTENGNTRYPVIADPTGTDLNQIWLKYSGKGVAATGGRQRILHGNQRFIGGVAWRQNEQTYDGLRVEWNPVESLRLDLAYVYNVNRIFGPDDGANPADLEGDNVFFRVDYSLADNHTLTGFGYFFDIDEDGPYPASKTVNNSSDTYGMEYSGKFDRFSLTASYAMQSEAGDSELDYDADYYLLELGAELGPVFLKGGYEVLGSDDGVGFSTPFATGHKFQGWADKFLSTPGDGIEDLYAGASGKLGQLKLAATYHDFQAEDSGEDFGDELDLSVTWPASERLTVQAKYASFDADSERYADTDKIWLVVQLKL